MSIRSRLLLLSFFVGTSIVAITVLFSSAIASIETIDREKAELVSLADSIRDLSIAVNSLDSNQYEGVAKKFDQARSRSEAAFEAVGKVAFLPRINEDLKNAFEIIGNMHALIVEDLVALDDQFRAFGPELETYFYESRSATVRMFYTNDRVRTQNDLTAVFERIENLVTGINGMTETLAAVSDTIQSQSALINEETGRIREQSLVWVLSLSGVILAVVLGISLFLGTSISRRVRTMQNGLGPVSQGDFSRYLTVKGSDEVAGMTRSINGLLDSLNRLLRQVQTQAESLGLLGSGLTAQMQESTSAVGQIQDYVGSSRQELASQTQAVAECLASARKLEGATARLTQAFAGQMDILGASSAGIEQIIASIRSVNGHTAQADGSSRVLQQVAEEGRTKMNLVARSVEEISRSSENLVQVTAIINNIADKTNLLAMNASIEAAHAGLAGRGFGVVASEIRKLAEQAASQAREIAKDLEIVNVNITSIRGATGAAVEVFHKILTQTEQVTGLIQDVQTSMEEQNQGGTQVLEGIHRLRDISAQVGDALEDMKRGEAEISSRVRDLAAQNARVNENNQAVDQKVKEIGDIITQTNGLAGSTGQQIETLKAETRQFKTSEAQVL